MTSSPWAGVGSAALAKVVVLGISGVLGIVTSRLILTNFGVDAYAQYGLLASLPALLPFADLGIGAVIVNAVAQSADARRDEYVTRAITTAFRILLISGALIVGAALVVQTTGLWPRILGEGLSGGYGGALAATLGLVIFGIGLPLSVGQRILVGLGRTSTQVASQAIVAPFVLLMVGLCAVASLSVSDYLSLFPYIGGMLVSAVCLAIAWRAMSPTVAQSVRAIPFPRRHPGVPAFGLAWPMLVQMVAIPIALQTDRLLVSHLDDARGLAEYNLAAQFFGLALQTIAAAGLALWPIFARARASNTIRTPARPALWFGVGGLLLAGLIVLLAPWLSAFVSDGEVTLEPMLLGWFAAYVVLQAVKYPIGMYMTDLAGLRFQVIPTIAMIPVSIGLGIWLIPLWGPSGAVAGSVVAVGLLQIVPSFLYVVRDLKRRRVHGASSNDVVPSPPS